MLVSGGSHPLGSDHPLIAASSALPADRGVTRVGETANLGIPRPGRLPAAGWLDIRMRTMSQERICFSHVIGLPDRFTEWCDAVTAEIARRALGPTELVYADTLEEISLAMIRTGASRAVVAARQPGGRLRSALVESGRTFLAVVEDPRTALAEAVHGQSNDVAAAAQLVASSCAGITRYVSSPGALALFRDRDGSDPAVTARAIARHLALNVSDADLVEIVNDLAAAGLTFERSDGAAQWDGLGVEEQRVVGGAVGPFVTYLATGNLPPIIWERELFFLGDRPSERATGIIDVTGRARRLLDGPHIMLPPGSWSLSLRLLFSRETTEHDFLVEVVADRQVASRTIQPQAEGVFEVDLAFALEATTEHPMSIRLSTQRAAFDGTVAVVEAVLTTDGAALAETGAAVAAGAAGRSV